MMKVAGTRVTLTSLRMTDIFYSVKSKWFQAAKQRTHSARGIAAAKNGETGSLAGLEESMMI
jgi:hypothetical protein